MPPLDADQAVTPMDRTTAETPPFPPSASTRRVALPDAALHLHEAVDLVRAHLGLDGILTDHEILASLRHITAAVTPRERWLAAFESQLGQWLSLSGADLNTTLSTLLALLPTPRS